MASVQRINDATFSVTIEVNGNQSQHTVTLNDDYHMRLTGAKLSKEELIEKTIDFLLQREAKEAILSSFDLTVVQKYYPEFEREIC